MSKKRLGRGLDALLSERSPKPVPVDVQGDARTDAVGDAQGELKNETPPAARGVAALPIDSIHPSPYQPRRHFDEEALADLANSIQRSGLLQPVVVRERGQGDYELIAGERRLRAATLAGLSEIPALVRAVSDTEASALALIENMQREDLGALEEALGLARLRDEFNLTQQQIADAVGKSRVAIANLLRLLNLGSITRQMLENGDLEMGHARALLALEGVTQDRAAQAVVEGGLSVRQTEAYVRRLQNPQSDKAKRSPRKDRDTERLEQRLADHLGAPAVVKHGRRGGELSIRYSTLEELDGILKRIGLEKE